MRKSEFNGWIRGESLGEGGQAWAFLAYREGDEHRKPFVLKVLKQKSNAARLKRFEREIEVGSRLRHPNVVSIEAQNLQTAQPYIIMEYCSGGELANLDLSELSLVERLRLFRGICGGVSHIHENGVIHRDLKPNNIFLRNDSRTPVVGDLGLCLIAEEDERLTETMEAVGARLFMAPELEDGRYEDARPVADIYSLGKILYWLISNKRVFSREKHQDQRFNLRSNQNDSTMALVYYMLDGMIVSEPTKRRYADANEVLIAMDETIQRIARGSHAVDLSVPQDCAYCGVGTYQTILHGNPQSSDFEDKTVYALGMKISNYTSSRAHRWLIMACDYCGNLQWFRTDLAKENPNAWQQGARP